MHYSLLNPIIFLWVAVIVSCMVQDSLQEDAKPFEMCYDESSCNDSKWPGICQSGPQQSPIDIPYNLLSFPFSFTGYDLIHNSQFYQIQDFTLTNNGHTAQLYLKPDLTSTTTMSGTLVGDTYTFSQLHMHWGNTAQGHGSEHTFNGKRYSLEFHYVHYKSKFNSFNDALTSGEQGAVTVLAKLFEVLSTRNVALDTVIEGLKKVHNASTKTNYVSLRLSDFFVPSKSAALNFVLYQGSLTTPPCTEKVNWVIDANPTQISEDQVYQIRTLLLTDKSTTLGYNNRGIQNNRNGRATTNYNVKYVKSSHHEG